MKITFLGTGSALGVPQVGCSCRVCLSPHEANKRKRSCYLIEHEGKTILLDPGPDTRSQLLEHNIARVDGVIITHAHHDHIGGYDELRICAIRQEGVIPTLIHEKNKDELKHRCGYLFKPGYTFFVLNELFDNQGHGHFLGLSYRYFTYVQNGMNVTGFIFGKLAFVSDMQNLNDEIVFHLKDVETLVVSCVLNSSSMQKSHLSLDEIYDLKARTGAKNVIITHMGHDIDYTKLADSLQPDVMLSYDGFIYEG